MAVSDYDERWLDVLRDAGKKEIVFPFSSFSEAHTLRQKLYRLRASMNKEKDSPPPGTSSEAWYLILRNANAVEMKIRFVTPDGTEHIYTNGKSTPIPEKLREKNPILLYLSPKMISYDDLLEKAGYAIPDIKL